MNVEIEYNLTGAVEDYAMFSELGNAAVHAIVVAARANDLTWAQVYRALRQLSEQEQFGEATDTMVREIVYSRIGADKRNESFWV
jgi:2-methylisocitrate lyase-like PEP mutase family enzyme